MFFFFRNDCCNMNILRSFLVCFLNKLLFIKTINFGHFLFSKMYFIMIRNSLYNEGFFLMVTINLPQFKCFF